MAETNGPRNEVVFAAAERYYETKYEIDGDPGQDLQERVPAEFHPAVQLLVGHMRMRRVASEKFPHLSPDSSFVQAVRDRAA